MIKRPFWINKIEKAWEKRPIVWLSGVRRVGKTTIAKMFPEAIYLNCDLPSVAHKLEDPEMFYRSLPEKSIVIFDEVHRLTDPSLVLKIAADVFPSLKVLATGSSTISATKKFKDSLTGRKRSIYLPPVLWEETISEFGITDLNRRLSHGGLPESLLSADKDPEFFAEWIDSFFARDIQELFGIRNRSGFIKLLHLLFRQSGGLADYSQLAKLSELTRPTVKSHIETMAISNALFLLPPFFGGSKREILRRPKIYAFDTGMVAFVKGWSELREEDAGILWEHLVLDTLRSFLLDVNLYFWRDKSGREVDFVVKKNETEVDVVECKINPAAFSPSNLFTFRNIYGHGKNYCVSPFVQEPYSIRKEGLKITFLSGRHLREFI